jgi:hypothetical protein
VTAKPSFLFGVVIVGNTLVQIMIIRIATGSYPSPWVFLAACVATVAGWMIGRSAALRRARR